MKDTTSIHVIGCDVGKNSIVTFDSRTRRCREIANRQAAIATFVADLPDDCLVVCEATGGWETALLDATVQAGIAAHRADARKVKAFIRSLGRIAKTDRIDAEGLARYGEERGDRLVRWQPTDPALLELQMMVRLRRDLVAQRAAHKQRLKAPAGTAIQPHLNPLLDQLDLSIDRLDTAIANLVEDINSLRLRVDTIAAIEGCGPVVAASMVALMPELGTLDRKACAALATTAPHPHQSGMRDGYRRVRGGRREIRPILFIAALSASRYNPQLRAFYKRLIAAGKKKIVAINAVMRKLVTIINARIRDALFANAQQLS